MGIQPRHFIPEKGKRQQGDRFKGLPKRANIGTVCPIIYIIKYGTRVEKKNYLMPTYIQVPCVLLKPFVE